MKHSFFIFLLFATLATSAQVSITTQMDKTLKDKAVAVIRNYTSQLNNIGSANFSQPDKEAFITKTLNMFESAQVNVYNDIADGSNEYDVQTYLQNIMTYYPQSYGGVVFNYTFQPVKRIYIDKHQSYLFAKVPVSRTMVGANSRAVKMDNTKQIDVFVKFVLKNGEPVIKALIYNIQQHTDDFNFTPVSISDGGDQPPPDGTGIVLITSTPTAADVWIGDKYENTTEVQKELPAGTYTYKVSKDLYYDETGSFTIAPDDTKRINLTLRPKFGAVVFKTSPEINASISLDGEPLNQKTSYTLSALKSGTHTLTLRCEGYEPYNETFTLADGKTYTVNATMKAIYGTISVSTNPAADIYIKDKKMDNGTYTGKLNSGTYTVVATRDKYNDETQSITITSGNTTTVTLTLQPKTGSLSVMTTPSDAQITLGTEDNGLSPKIIPNLLIGDYNITLAKQGYITLTKTITITENQRYKLNETLQQGETPHENDDMVFVKGEQFTMGGDEYTEHKVTLSDYYISKYEVSQKLYKQVMNKNPSNFKGDKLPVEKVSWYDAIEFCNAYSKHDKLTPCYTINGTNVTCNFAANGYRLPTEAEWEYAARGGIKSKGYKYSGSDNIDDVAEYEGNNNKTTKPVGGRNANELGIYDMSGNVWEWCWDWYDDNYYANSPENNPKGADTGSNRVARGGSWFHNATRARVVNRSNSTPTYSDNYLGFRVVRTF